MAITALFDENLITTIRKEVGKLFYFVKLSLSYDQHQYNNTQFNIQVKYIVHHFAENILLERTLRSVGWIQH